jgi:hypothetical protein
MTDMSVNPFFSKLVRSHKRVRANGVTVHLTASGVQLFPKELCVDWRDTQAGYAQATVTHEGFAITS